jgi:hypothetical protein
LALHFDFYWDINQPSNLRVVEENMECISSVYSNNTNVGEKGTQTIIQWIYGRKKWFYFLEIDLFVGFLARDFSYNETSIKETGIRIFELPPFSELCIKLRYENAFVNTENNSITFIHPNLGSITLKEIPSLSNPEINLLQAPAPVSTGLQKYPV